MIQANELRLKNLFRDKLTGALLSVCGLDEEDERVDFRVVDRSKYPLPEGWQAEPIPLTAEVLQACGFEKDNFAEFIENGEWIVKEKWVSVDRELELFDVTLVGKDGLGNDRCYGRRMKGFHRYRPIRHLDQLQNLYFALVGQELPINLEQVKA